MTKIGRLVSRTCCAFSRSIRSAPNPVAASRALSALPCYDDETREFVRAYYARDIAAFGYRFETSPLRSAWLRVQSLFAPIEPDLRTIPGQKPIAE